MKIALISNMTPAAENVRGTSALPFHLMVHRPKGVEVDVYTLDYNQLPSVFIGIGTKGKVLEVLSNGLLVIGIWYAMENIAVRNGESCVISDSLSEFVDWLKELAADCSLIPQIANKGREDVLTEHGRAKVSEEFFKYFV